MLQFEELRLKLQGMEPELRELKQSLNIDKLGIEIAELERKAAEPSFWDDMENSQKVLQRTSQLKASVETYNKLQALYEDTLTLIELAEEAGDESVYEEAAADTEQLQTRMAEVRLTTLLTGEYDSKNAILTFHAGAGGTEAQDWAQMLYRMYTRWAERHGYSYKILDYLDGDEAGIKSASILIEGMNAYGFLKSENGVHRLVRVSPFDASGRRQTSFASLEVMPEIDDDYDIEINPADLKIDTYRSGGAGGQHVNKTESAIRITHLPTGTVVECQDERSQYKNKDKAMKILRSRIYEKMQREQEEKIASERKLQVGAGDRAERIRTYNYPQGRVTDHRIGLTLYKLEQILNGDLTELFDALNTFDQAEKLKESSGSTGGEN